MQNTKQRRPIGRLFYLAAMILIAASGLRAADAPATTLIHDTIYRANGTPAKGTLVISWPAFESADHHTVAAGTLTVALGDGGLLDVPLAPNQGATPLGTYYKVVTKLDDGTTTTEFWNVPDISPATVASVRTTVLAGPAETPTANYVQEAEVSTDPLPNKIPRADANGKIAEAWIPNTVSTPLQHDATSDVLSCPTCLTTGGIETITGRKTFSQQPLGVTGGSNAQIQFNDGGLFGGDPNFTWDTTNGLNAKKGVTLDGVRSALSGWDSALAVYNAADTTGAAGNGWAHGVDSEPAIQGNTALATLASYYAAPDISQPGTGAVGTLTGLYSGRPTTGGAHPVTEAHGVHVASYAGIGSTLNAGVYVSDQGAGATDYAIYSQGGQNYFGGKSKLAGPVLAGSNATNYDGQTVALDVDQNLGVNGDIRLAGGSSTAPDGSTRSGVTFPRLWSVTGASPSLLAGSPLQSTTSQAGLDLRLWASDAAPGTSVTGAASGGNVQINAGDANRLTSGDADGGNIILHGGGYVGNGRYGQIRIDGQGTSPTADYGTYTAYLQSNDAPGVNVGASLGFIGRSNNGVDPYEFGVIQGAKESASAGDYSGFIRFFTTASNGGIVERLRVSSGGISTTGYLDVTEIAAPVNPSAGTERWYADSTTHQLACLTSGGGNCLPSGAGSGTVTSFSAGNLSPLFTTSVANAITTPALSFSLSNAAAGTVFGNPTGSLAAPAYSNKIGLIEGAAPAGIAGLDLLYPDSTAHRWKMINNNGTAAQVVASGADINTSDQVTATHLAAALPINQGGTGTATTLTGLVRGSGSAMTAAEISGDCTTSGSNAITCTKTNNVAFAAAATTGYALFFGSSTGASMAACSNGGGTTSFIGLGGTTNTTEASVIRFLVPASGTLKNFNVKLSANVPASESAAFKISKNGSTTGTPAVTVAAGASTAIEDTSTTTAVAAGDLISVAVTCSGGTTALSGPVSATVMVQ